MVDYKEQFMLLLEEHNQLKEKYRELEQDFQEKCDENVTLTVEMSELMDNYSSLENSAKEASRIIQSLSKALGIQEGLTGNVVTKAVKTH